MPKEDIIRGLEGAMAKGETLERAMYSFYNAGYNKQEVEEAARALSVHLSVQESRLPVKPVLQIQKTMQKPAEIQQAKPIVPLEELKPKQSLHPLEQLNSLENRDEKQEPKMIQDVSKYEPKQKINSRTVLIVILSVVLAILVGSLVGIFLFKDTLIKMFSGFF